MLPKGSLVCPGRRAGARNALAAPTLVARPDGHGIEGHAHDQESDVRITAKLMLGLAAGLAVLGLAQLFRQPPAAADPLKPESGLVHRLEVAEARLQDLGKIEARMADLEKG